MLCSVTKHCKVLSLQKDGVAKRKLFHTRELGCTLCKQLRGQSIDIEVRRQLSGKNPPRTCACASTHSATQRRSVPLLRLQIPACPALRVSGITQCKLGYVVPFQHRQKHITPRDVRGLGGRSRNPPRLKLNHPPGSRLWSLWLTRFLLLTGPTPQSRRLHGVR